MIPSYNECIEMLRNARCSEDVIKHCIAVRNVAIKIAEKTEADQDLVNAGALLHDIGRSKTHGIKHIIEGVKIGKKLCLDDSILKIIERHIGAGLPKEEAKKLGLPTKDYMPETLEEKIICHSDNLIIDGNRQPIELEIEKALSKGLNEYALRLLILHKELCDITGVDLNKI
jgi:uncharacterized protein (TIGR00295 family)